MREDSALFLDTRPWSGARDPWQRAVSGTLMEALFPPLKKEAKQRFGFPRERSQRHRLFFFPSADRSRFFSPLKEKKDGVTVLFSLPRWTTGFFFVVRWEDMESYRLFFLLPRSQTGFFPFPLAREERGRPAFLFLIGLRPPPLFSLPDRVREKCLCPAFFSFLFFPPRWPRGGRPDPDVFPSLLAQGGEKPTLRSFFFFGGKIALFFFQATGTDGRRVGLSRAFCLRRIEGMNGFFADIFVWNHRARVFPFFLSQVVGEGYFSLSPPFFQAAMVREA